MTTTDDDDEDGEDDEDEDEDEVETWQVARLTRFPLKDGLRLTFGG